MDYSRILTDEERRHHANLRAEICRKYARQFWDAHNGNELPHLALIINDAIGEAINAHFPIGEKV